MLILTRTLGQSIKVGDVITVTVLYVHKTYVKLGISAPDHIQVWRKELYEKKQESHPPE